MENHVTETTTRRGIKPLLALLLSGVAFLMMGATRPVQAAQVTNLVVSLGKGGTVSNDQVGFSCSTSWDTHQTPTAQASWTMVEYVQYYNANGIDGSPTQVYIAGGSVSSPANSYTAGELPPGYLNAKLSAPSDATGGTWWYQVTVSINDSQSNVVYASATKITDTQSYGAIPGSGTPAPPNPGV
jgi:hypothetical protein